MKLLKGYLATHFFNDSGFKWTHELAKTIRESASIDLYVPQENSEINDKSGDDSNITAVAIANGDNKYLREANVLIASLDGVEIDSGVSAEIGYFSGLIESERRLVAQPRTRYIIGLYTDIRRDGSGDNHYYINLYTKGLVQLYGTVVHNNDELKSVLRGIQSKIRIENQIRGKI
ncbi:MAG TPA: nucleoside 2-deoxyribosyltransferase [Pseudoneobacillus sp.]|nr:nucleoside 2-deoxyribosyltransferase [Pseudoneobacillus sp.]